MNGKPTASGRSARHGGRFGPSGRGPYDVWPDGARSVPGAEPGRVARGGCLSSATRRRDGRVKLFDGGVHFSLPRPRARR